MGRAACVRPDGLMYRHWLYSKWDEETSSGVTGPKPISTRSRLYYVEIRLQEKAMEEAGRSVRRRLQ